MRCTSHTGEDIRANAQGGYRIFSFFCTASCGVSPQRPGGFGLVVATFFQGIVNSLLFLLACKSFNDDRSVRRIFCCCDTDRREDPEGGSYCFPEPTWSVRAHWTIADISRPFVTFQSLLCLFSIFTSGIFVPRPFV